MSVWGIPLSPASSSVQLARIEFTAKSYRMAYFFGVDWEQKGRSAAAVTDNKLDLTRSIVGISHELPIASSLFLAQFPTCHRAKQRADFRSHSCKFPIPHYFRYLQPGATSLRIIGVTMLD